MSLQNPISKAKNIICSTLSKCIKQKLNVEIPAASLLKCCEKTKNNKGEVGIHFYRFKKVFSMASDKTAAILNDEISNLLKSNSSDILKSIILKSETNGPYLNFYIKLSFFGKEVLSTLHENSNFFTRREQHGERIMVEYSQPNTHKAFHVGHMRNVALGDSLVRTYRHLGHNVVAVNYFGDEGAHVAKCLWLLQKAISPENLEKVEKKERGEFLGAFYSKSVELLDLSTYTCLPILNAIAVKVAHIEKHPNHQTWNIVKVQVGAKKFYKVVCNGVGFETGDFVAYMPLDGYINGKKVVEKEMKGVISQGIILGIDEVPGASKFSKFDKNKKTAKTEKTDKNNGKDKRIFKLPEKFCKMGLELVEIGRTSENFENGLNIIRKTNKKLKLEDFGKNFDNIDLINLGNLSSVQKIGEDYQYIESRTDKAISKYTNYLKNNIYPPKDKNLTKFYLNLKKEVSETQKNIEFCEGESTDLWKKTRKWSLDEFKRIYNWLNCNFDHDFFESEVSPGSKEIVHEYLEKGVFVRDQGCIGADLKNEKLGFCILEKTNGSGLYATKDLKLAQVKFDRFNVQKSIYVVDISQTFHFRQVFACLAKMGYERVKNCKHLAYALVTLPHGKMSSRGGSVIVFSELVDLLEMNIRERFFSKDKIGNKDYWTKERIKDAIHKISVGTIKYGMLNQDATKNIVFNLSEWTNPLGNTCSYLMYQYTRICSILREVDCDMSQCTPEMFDIFEHLLDRYLIFQCLRFWDIVEICIEKDNPLTLCTYLYDLCKSFSSWYNLPEKKIKKITNENLKRAHISQLIFLKECIKTSLDLLGISVLERM